MTERINGIPWKTSCHPEGTTSGSDRGDPVENKLSSRGSGATVGIPWTDHNNKHIPFSIPKNPKKNNPAPKYGAGIVFYPTILNLKFYLIIK